MGRKKFEDSSVLLGAQASEAVVVHCLQCDFLCIIPFVSCPGVAF